MAATPDADPSPLSLAAEQADDDAVRALLAAGAAVDGDNHAPCTPLWHACAGSAPPERRLAVAMLLLQAGAAVRRACDGGATALHAAASRGPLALVDLLIRHGALSWQADATGATALDWARRGSAPDKDQIVELLDRPVLRDALFREAVRAIQAGDLAELCRLLDAHPRLLRERAVEPDCYPNDYFRDPRLFWFIANNPTLIERMPANIAAIADAMIARGVAPADLDYALELVMTSAPARTQGHQIALMNRLTRAGATASSRAILMTLGHRERGPVEALLAGGMPLTAPIAAGLGRVADLQKLLPTACTADRQAALAMAVINQETACARLCLQAGADVNAFIPVHSHSTALHAAADNDDVAMLQLLVAHGARTDVRDTLWNGTALNWATHMKRSHAEAYLRTLSV